MTSTKKTTRSKPRTIRARRRSVRRVMVFGTFDAVHPGHIDMFRQARDHGDYLIVVVARDANVKKFKGKRPMFSENERVELLSQLDEVDQAILGHPTDFLHAIKKYKPDVICLGYDQNTDRIPGFDAYIQKTRRLSLKRMKPFGQSHFKSSQIKSVMK